MPTSEALAKDVSAQERAASSSSTRSGYVFAIGAFVLFATLILTNMNC